MTAPESPDTPLSAPVAAAEGASGATEPANACGQRVCTTTAIPTPPWADRINPITIDSCIADTVVKLWLRGVETLGSCCGHGRSRPSLVLADGAEMPGAAMSALDAIDPDRDWELLQWQLVSINRAPHA